MLPVLSKDDSYILDQLTVESGISSYNQIMIKAGQVIAQYLVENIDNSFNKKFIILAGPGNNGGDAIIAHFYFLNYGINSTLLLFDKNQIKNWYFEDLSISKDSYQFYNSSYNMSKENYYIDGLFGIGLKRKIKGLYKDAINHLNNCKNIISIDIPSGIYSDSGNSDGINIIASHTLAINNYKIGHFFNEGLNSSGKVIPLNIGLIKNNYVSSNSLQLIEKKDLLNKWPKYDIGGHKYSRGTVITLAGSKGLTGAAILAINAAIKSGSGIVKAIIPSSLSYIYENHILECISIPIDDSLNKGTFSIDNVDAILSSLSLADAVIFGPGLSCGDFSSHWKSKVLSLINSNLVLDASGFEPLIENKLNISDLPSRTILTPHYGEFAKIFKFNLEYLNKNILKCVREIIPLLKKRILILKGPTTIVVDSKENLHIISNGSKLLATAGTGDVLTGIIGSLLGQGVNLDNAAMLSIFLHAECSNYYIEEVASNGLVASDLIDIIPKQIEMFINEN